MRHSKSGIFAGLGFLVACPCLLTAGQSASADRSGPGRSSQAPERVCSPSKMGSPYIPVDNWMYPALLRLYSLGFIDNAYLGMRPWTRLSVDRMLDVAAGRLVDAEPGPVTDEARAIYQSLMHELSPDIQGPCLAHEGSFRQESAYSAARAISGTSLRDSFHLGSTVVNDYGRPYESGFNSYSGLSGYATAGRFTLYARGEFQSAPSAAGYSAALAQELANQDVGFYPVKIDPATGLPYSQTTIPEGPIGTAIQGRWVEAYASVHILSHEVSFGKQDEWLGPGMGGAMAYSNNAENIYAFHINRVEPLHVPLLSILTGPLRYEFLVGSLKGHTYPNDPWVHLEKISLKPTSNLEVGFERTVIWGGKGHEPITLHSFLRSFFSLTNVTQAVKDSRSDPGARFGAFDFSYRLPFVRNWLTLYADGEVHDDVSPIDAPRRASWRPGLYLSHFPGIPKLDIRAEAVTTDPPVSRSFDGEFMYWESIEQQGYTNNGQLFGDWIGREDKGGQAWITYHLSGNEWLQASMRNQKAAKDFIPGSTSIYMPGTNTLIEGGTTLNDISFQAVKRLNPDLEIRGSFAWERWKAPIYLPGPQTVTNTMIQLTWYPTRKVSF